MVPAGSLQQLTSTIRQSVSQTCCTHSGSRDDDYRDDIHRATHKVPSARTVPAAYRCASLGSELLSTVKLTAVQI
ncbi:hypothetical protein RRG08_039470 [Elysia crispata]|uniref:Uncharacterized protein n=1 Tax=Elysia crispata TaxID=231223 RepID=A0AAE1D022_9GAST|nr:hypothetical protein RRG08_039470 [Elysia crispata]